ncbi:MAG: alpha/beta fold hydrolase [bacterium]|nr:alpha/beta fold hydrolase [bacterium]
MSACETIEIVTPKKVLLNGLWFGPSFAKASKGKPSKPKKVIIWIHGLGSSAFSKLAIVEKLKDKNTAVITFNNRGHDKVSRIAFTDEKRSANQTLGGSAHEVFEDCVDDIQGAINFLKKAGIKNIYLAGHSTGCQKSIYWASRKGARGLPASRTRQAGVKGIILLAPISDYSAEMHLKGKNVIARAAAAARALLARKKPRALLPESLWPEPIDAQRFISLYTPDSAEEMFTYAQPKKIPRLLQSVKLPIFALLADEDEFADRPAVEIAEWFERNTDANLETLIVPRATHGFRGKELQVSDAIKTWLSER